MKLGVTNGKLAPCSKSLNCVSTQGKGKHFIEPIPYVCSRKEARYKILSILKSMARLKIITHTGDYIHAEFRTPLMRFVDDVEFYFPKEKRIHFRSASRKQYSGFGTNRIRMEKITKFFSESYI